MEKCADGYTDAGLTCTKAGCPSGLLRVGALCYKDCPSNFPHVSWVEGVGGGAGAYRGRHPQAGRLVDTPPPTPSHLTSRLQIYETISCRRGCPSGTDVETPLTCTVCTDHGDLKSRLYCKKHCCGGVCTKTANYDCGKDLNPRGEWRQRGELFCVKFSCETIQRM